MPIGNAFTILKSRQSPKNAIVIKDQPDDTNLSIGSTLTLSLSCVGTFPISAQWRKDNINYRPLSITNNGDVKLQISNIKNSDEGNYDCVLSNIVGSVTSNKANFTINRPPVFTINPVDATKNVGESYTLLASATGTNPISYQWIKDYYNFGIYSNSYIFNNLKIIDSGSYACIASNLYGSVTSTIVNLLVKNIPIIAKSIYASLGTSFFLGTDGTVSACGTNNYGELGDGTTITNTYRPIKINIPSVSMACGGYSHTLFLGTDGTVSACGRNNYGQLGDGTTTNRLIPVKLNLPPVKMIAARTQHSIFLGVDGTVSACGANGSGQLGDGTTTNRSTPVKINLPPVKMIGTGIDHTLFLGVDDTLSGCGNNTWGQLLNLTHNNLNTIPIPKKLNLPPISSIGVTREASIVLGTNGSVSAFGRNISGVLGVDVSNYTNTAIKISLPPVKEIFTGEYNSFFIGTNGGLSACGRNNYGQLGDGTTTERSTPVNIDLPSVKMIAAGIDHTLFIGLNNSVSGCGYNLGGQLGDGTPINRINPVII